LNSLLHRLLKVYFSNMPKPFFEKAHRKILIFGIFFYRLLIRRFISNHCQFSVTCSQFTLDLLRRDGKFKDISLLCLQRFCECSRPFDRIQVGKEVIFISCMGRQVDVQEVNLQTFADAK